MAEFGNKKGISKEEWFLKNKAFYQKLFPTMERCGVNVLCENSTSANLGGDYFINTGKDMRDTVNPGVTYHASGCLVHGLSVVADSLLAVRKRDCTFLCSRQSFRLFSQQLIYLAGELNCIAGLAGSRGPQNAYQVDFPGQIFVKDFLYIDLFCRRELRHRGNGSE